MSGHAVFRLSLVLAGFVLGAAGVAQAKIPQSQPAAVGAPYLANPNGLSEYLNQLPAVPVSGGSEADKIITLNFGPLHFQEILKTTPKACRS